MNDATATWQELKAEYLRKVENALAKVDHPRKHEVLADLSRHLDLRFDELDPGERTVAALKSLIEDMGPPEEYADLLAPESGRPTWSIPWRKISRAVRWLALGAAFLLLAVTFFRSDLALPVLRSLNVMLFIGVDAALFVQYRRTRDSGLLWLGGALIFWPLAMMVIGWQSRTLVDRLQAGDGEVWLWPFRQVAHGKMPLRTALATLAALQRFGSYVLLLVGLTKLKLGKNLCLGHHAEPPQGRA